MIVGWQWVLTYPGFPPDGWMVHAELLRHRRSGQLSLKHMWMAFSRRGSSRTGGCHRGSGSTWQIMAAQDCVEISLIWLKCFFPFLGVGEGYESIPRYTKHHRESRLGMNILAEIPSLLDLDD